MNADEESFRRLSSASFAITSTKQRIITTSILLALVATILPYQFAYLVLCIVQVVTTIRAWRSLREAVGVLSREDDEGALTIAQRSDAAYNFYNYSHSLLVLMIWILPINLPVLVVWVRNLAVQWLTPFSSHHNILSIVPFILLVETSATGKMAPRVLSRFRHVTTGCLLLLALYAAVYGVSYAYTLHQVANMFCGWMVLVLWFTGSWELDKVIDDVVSGQEDGKPKKRP
jgi:glycosylphosphatidylinositol deacylase